MGLAKIAQSANEEFIIGRRDSDLNASFDQDEQDKYDAEDLEVEEYANALKDELGYFPFDVRRIYNKVSSIPEAIEYVKDRVLKVNSEYSDPHPSIDREDYVDYVLNRVQRATDIGLSGSEPLLNSLYDKGLSIKDAIKYFHFYVQDYDDEAEKIMAKYDSDDLVVDEADVDDENDLQGSGEVSVQVGDEAPVVKEFEFTLPVVPGGENQEEIEDSSDLEVEEEPDEIEVDEPDAWDWSRRGGISMFPNWLQGMMQNVPKHSGHDTSGLERAIAYLSAVDREISKAVRMDLKSELDVSQLEKARDEIQKGCDRLAERLDKIIKNKRPKKKKKSEAEEAGLVKEAQKITGVKGIMVTVPLLISRIARVCINGMVSGGHDIERLYKNQVDLYSLTLREKAEVLQLLDDMGYPIRRDRGIHPDEDIDRTRTDNLDWNANYPA